MSLTSKRIEHGYATINLVLDELGRERVPVGVAAWDADRQWYDVRILSKDEKVRGVSKARLTFAEAVHSQVRNWAEERSVPYAGREVFPWESTFWHAVRQVLTTAVKIDPPRTMDPMKFPDEEMESLFSAVVQPEIEESEKVTRIDGAVGQALGPWRDVFDARAPMRAFGGAEERVIRGFRSDRGSVIVEGVNLAGSTARKDADALVSKLLRIREGEDGAGVHFVVAYQASPGGLNGEAHMRNWIKAKVTTDVFDVVRQQKQLQTATKRALSNVTPNIQYEMRPDSQ